MTIKVGSCFSGIEGFGLGLEQAGGFDIVWQIELDDDAVSVLERHYPNTTRYRDITEVHGDGLAAIDVLVGGWPCQDLSVAGARAGLAGERSGLFFEIARLARECAASWVLFENVPGLASSFSSDNPPPRDLEPGRSWESEETSDLGIVLDTLSECGYGWAFRTLDARYLGVPQRRRRVFVVGCLGDSGVRPAQVLFESDSSPWDPAPSRTARQGSAADTEGSVGVTGFKESQSGARESDVVGVQDANYGSRRHNGVMAPVAAFGGNRTSGEIEVSTAVNAHGGPHGRLDFESETFIVDATNGAQGAGDPGTLGTEQAKGNRGQMIASPITASAGHHGRSSPRGDGADNLVVADTIRSHPRPGSNSLGNDVAQEGPSVAPPLTAGGHPNSNIPGRHREDDENLVSLDVKAFDWQKGGGGNDHSWRGKSREWIERAGDYTGSLSATKHDAIALHLTQDPINGPESPALGAGNESGCSSIGVATFDSRNVTSRENRTRVESGLPAGTLHQDGLSVITPMAVSENQRAEVRETDYSRQLATGGGKPGQGYPSVRAGMTVRRLTPREFERLQGFPDDWTRWRADGREVSDGVRYRLVGNAVAVPVITWIGRRLRMVMERGDD